MAGKVLTDRQQRFVLEYPKDCNAAAAARRAGYSEKTAKEQGYENLTRPHIFEAVQEAIRRHLAKLDLSLERIIQEVARVGISDIRDLFHPETHALLDPHEMPDNVRKAIASIKFHNREVKESPPGEEPQVTTTVDLVEVKFWPKLAGLELLAKLKGLLKPELKLEPGSGWKAVLHSCTPRTPRSELVGSKEVVLSESATNKSRRPTGEIAGGGASGTGNQTR